MAVVLVCVFSWLPRVWRTCGPSAQLLQQPQLVADAGMLTGMLPQSVLLKLRRNMRHLSGQHDMA